MFSTDNNDDEAQGFTMEEAALEPFHYMIDDALKRVQAGQSIDQVMEALSGQLPPSLRELAKRCIARRSKNMPKAPIDLFAPIESAAPSAAPPVAKPQNVAQRVGGGLAAIAGLLSQNMMQKIRQLLNLNPKLNAVIRDAGQILAANGVTPDKIRVTESMLGDLAPTQGVGQSREKGGPDQRAT